MFARHLGWSAGAALLAAVAVVLLAPRVGAEDKDKKDKLDLDKIPRKVMAALKAKFPKAEIHKWTKEKEGDAEVYDIEFKIGEKKYEADIKEDGTIVNWEKEIAIKDLPRAVTAAIEKKYPKSKLKDAMEITDVKDKKEAHGGYEVNLVTADKKDVEVTVTAGGKITEDSSEKKGKDKN